MVGRLSSAVVQNIVLRVAQSRLHERRLHAHRPVPTRRPRNRPNSKNKAPTTSSDGDESPRWREAAAKPPHHAKPPLRRLNEHTKKLDYYTGNYDSYVRERSIRDDEQQRKYDAEQRDIAEIKDFIARLEAASECTQNRK